MRWKTRARLSAVAFLTGAVLGTSSALTGVMQAGPPDIEKMAADTARRHVDIFLVHALLGEADDAAVLAPGHGWVSPVTMIGTERLVARARDGGIIVLPLAGVADWVFTGPDGKLYGAFQTRARLPEMPPEDAEPLLDALSATPLPPSPRLSPDNRDFLLAATARSL